MMIQPITPINRSKNYAHIRAHGMRPPASEDAPKKEARPSVLLALGEREFPTQGALRAAALARVLGADLHVIRVMRGLPRVNVLFPQRSVRDSITALARIPEAERATRDWIHQTLGATQSVAAFTMVDGDFIERVAHHAAGIYAKLIVVSAWDKRMGRLVTSLARASGTPVLVARRSTHDGTIVAATDLERPELPVLRSAAALGVRLEAPLVAVHNVRPQPVVVAHEVVYPVAAASDQSVIEAQIQRLLRASSGLAVNTVPVVRSEIDAVEAILEEARMRDADLIVVGARNKNWLGRFMRAGIAARVVNRSKQSVLVLPLSRRA